MRQRAGLLACALSLPLLACTSFSAVDDGAIEAGAPETSASGDAAAPSTQGVVIVNVAGATEIVADDSRVVWNTPDAVMAAPLMENATATPLAMVPNAKSLQIDDTDARVFFASGEQVSYANTDGSSLAMGARSVTLPDANNDVVACRLVNPTALAFARQKDFLYCRGDACNTNSGTQVSLNGGTVGIFGGERNGDHLWMTVGETLRSYETTNFMLDAQIQVAGGVRAFAIDPLVAYIAPMTGNQVLAQDRQAPNSAPKMLSTVAGSPWALAVDATYLYVVVFATGGGSLLAVDKSTNAVTTLAPMLREPQAIALTTSSVLVLSNGQILQFAKPRAD